MTGSWRPNFRHARYFIITPSNILENSISRLYPDGTNLDCSTRPGGQQQDRDRNSQVDPHQSFFPLLQRREFDLAALTVRPQQRQALQRRRQPPGGISAQNNQHCDDQMLGQDRYRPSVGNGKKPLVGRTGAHLEQPRSHQHDQRYPTHQLQPAGDLTQKGRINLTLQSFARCGQHQLGQGSLPPDPCYGREHVQPIDRCEHSHGI